MRLRTKHVADSVLERITAARQAVETGNEPRQVQSFNMTPAEEADRMEQEMLHAAYAQQQQQEQQQQPAPQGGAAPQVPGLDESGADPATVLGGGDMFDALLNAN
jgi:hypothetical protein